jgi:hypothetical protein
MYSKKEKNLEKLPEPWVMEMEDGQIVEGQGAIGSKQQRL